MSAAELRQAADTLRGLVKAAPVGYWWVALAKFPSDPEGDWIVDSGDRLIAGNIGIESDPEALPIAEYIAAMQPTVGAALADWLEHIAIRVDTGQAMDHAGLIVARLINGGE